MNVLLHIAARPLVLPACCLSFGLWYGSFKLFWTVHRLIFDQKGKGDSKYPRASKLLALCTGGTSLYISKICMPPSEHVHDVALLQMNHIKEFPKYIKNSVLYLKGFPFKYCIICIATSGFISGFIVAFYESREG